ncbi:MAG: BlaI/MecI/CopY family transcriptional regulator [Lachnospiraceae bacterium]
MQRYGIGEQEMKFARLLWDREGIGSGEVVKLCEKELGWKKSTTYTMLRRLCEHGLFQNVNSIVTSLMSEEEYKAKVGEDMINDKFNGSLPMFVAAFTKRRELSEQDKKELLEIIEGYKTNK